MKHTGLAKRLDGIPKGSWLICIHTHTHSNIATHKLKPFSILGPSHLTLFS